MNHSGHGQLVNCSFPLSWVGCGWGRCLWWAVGAAVLEAVLIDTHVLELQHSPPGRWVRLGSAGWDEGTVILMRCGVCKLHAWSCSREHPMMGHAPTPVFPSVRSCSADLVLSPAGQLLGLFLTSQQQTGPATSEQSLRCCICRQFLELSLNFFGCLHQCMGCPCAGICSDQNGGHCLGGSLG